MKFIPEEVFPVLGDEAMIYASYLLPSIKTNLPGPALISYIGTKLGEFLNIPFESEDTSAILIALSMAYGIGIADSMIVEDKLKRMEQHNN